MMRRRIRDPQLTVELTRAGRRTRTTIAVAYLKDVADVGVVSEVQARLKRIDVDGVLESSYVEQYIEDQTFTPFPTVAYSERPDVVASRILEGRVAILVDGSPEVLTVPHVYMENFQPPEDYYSRVYYANLVRWFRYLAFSISLLTPGIYVALTTYHQQLIPTSLLLTIASAQEGTPFPTVVEVLGLGLVFEILREAGIRLPKPIGQAVSIVGVLVIGQAAVSAGVVSSPVVIIVSVTAIASFLNPWLTEAGLVGRLLLTIPAAILGGYGLVLGMLALLAHVASLRSFGTPYLAPVMPPSPRGLLQDTFVRVPVWAMNTRPARIAKRDVRRQVPGQAPQPPKRRSRVKKR